MKNKIKIPIWPLIHIEAIFSLIDVYMGKYWSWYGKYERSFINKFSKLHKIKYAFMTSSGTSALENCLRVLDIKDGDEVIVPAYTWMSTATAVLQAGAKPVFVDIDEKTLCISPKEIEKAITEKTKAIIPVHLFSSVADMKEICLIAKKHNLKIIEDCAHSIGAEYKGKPAGSIGNVSAFSFQQSKILSSGEGGICATNDSKLAMKLDKLLHIGFSVFPNNNEKVIPTKNLATEFQAAVLDNQFNYLEKENQTRAENAKYLESLLKELPYLRFQQTPEGTQKRSYYKFVFMIDSEKLKDGCSLQDIISALKKNGLPAENTYGSVVYKFFAWQVQEDKYIKHACSTAEKISEKEIICLPHTILLMKKQDLKKTAEIIAESLRPYFSEDKPNV